MHKDNTALYRLLAHALTYPDQHFITNVQVAVGKIDVELYDDASLPLGALVQELGKLSSLPLDQVQGEHTRLFINAYPHVPCPPYESAYREGELLGAAAEQVDVLYREWGLVVEGEQVDHVAAELEFVAFLLTLDTPEARNAAETFTRDHLARWVPRFAEDVIRESRLGFYREAGRLLAIMVREEFALT